MKNQKKILAEITQLTLNIEKNYPELYHFLEENPITIPSTEKPNINLDVLQNYLQSLKQLIKHHKETHKNSKK